MVESVSVPSRSNSGNISCVEDVSRIRLDGDGSAGKLALDEDICNCRLERDELTTEWFACLLPLRWQFLLRCLEYLEALLVPLRFFVLLFGDRYRFCGGDSDGNFNCFLLIVSVNLISHN